MHGQDRRHNIIPYTHNAQKFSPPVRPCVKAAGEKSGKSSFSPTPGFVLCMEPVGSPSQTVEIRFGRVARVLSAMSSVVHQRLFRRQQQRAGLLGEATCARNSYVNKKESKTTIAIVSEDKNPIAEV